MEALCKTGLSLQPIQDSLYLHPASPLPSVGCLTTLLSRRKRDAYFRHAMLTGLVALAGLAHRFCGRACKDETKGHSEDGYVLGLMLRVRNEVKGPSCGL